MELWDSFLVGNWFEPVLTKQEETTIQRQFVWNSFYCNNNCGLDVECTKCKKWRKVYDYEEPRQVPEDYQCSMANIGIRRGSWDIPSDLTDFSSDKYTPGSVVWPKHGGFPWWPGIVDDNPDSTLEDFTWSPNGKKLYHVTYFGEEVSRSWVKEQRIAPFVSRPKSTVSKKYKCQLERAIQQAEQAGAMDIQVASTNSTSKRTKKQKRNSQKAAHADTEFPAVFLETERADKEKKVPKRKTRVSQECWADSLEYKECVESRRSEKTKKGRKLEDVIADIIKEESLDDLPICENFIDNYEITNSDVVIDDSPILESGAADYIITSTEDSLSYEALPVGTHTHDLQQPCTSRCDLSSPITSSFPFTSSFAYDGTSSMYAEESVAMDDDIKLLGFVKNEKRDQKKSKSKIFEVSSDVSTITKEIKQEMIDDGCYTENAIVEVPWAENQELDEVKEEPPLYEMSLFGAQLEF